MEKIAIALILADTHLKEDNIEINKSIYRQATEIAKGLGLTQIEHAGDIFNSRKAQTQSTLDAFDDIVTEAHESGIKWNVVVGNHDKTDYSSKVSFVKQFRHHPSVTIHSLGGYRKLTDTINLHYAAFFSDSEYMDQLEYMKASNKFNAQNVLLTHIGIAGSVMNSGIVIESASIVPSLFKDYDLTLVGHFHDAQVLAEGRVKYIGASLQHNFGELTGKGATVLYDDLTTEIIQLKSPQFIKYEIAPKDLTLSDIADLKQEKETSGDNIRIILTGSEADIKSFDKKILDEAGISVKHKTEDINKEELEQRVEAFNVVSLKEEFEIFCEKNNLDLETGMRYFNKIIAA